MANFTWYGHAAVKIELVGRTVFIDPMLQNPNSPIKPSEVTKADLVYVTHDHPDHLGDAFDICKRTGAIFAAVYELAEKAHQNGVKNIARLNVGGSFTLGELKLTVVAAIHSAAVGTPTGAIVNGEGLTIYHAGDTALIGDMRLLGDRFTIDLACLPIGGNYTMDAEQAAEAAKMLKTKMVFPLHYGTFPPLAKDNMEFKEKIKLIIPEVKVLELKPGQSCTLSSRQMGNSV